MNQVLLEIQCVPKCVTQVQFGCKQYSHILLASIGIGVQNIFSFGAQIWPDYSTRDVGLSNSMEQPMKLRCCMFNRVFLVNHWHDFLDCSCKWLYFINSYIGPTP